MRVRDFRSSDSIPCAPVRTSMPSAASVPNDCHSPRKRQYNRNRHPGKLPQTDTPEKCTSAENLSNAPLSTTPKSIKARRSGSKCNRNPGNKRPGSAQKTRSVTIAVTDRERIIGPGIRTAASRDSKAYYHIPGTPKIREKYPHIEKHIRHFQKIFP